MRSINKEIGKIPEFEQKLQQNAEVIKTRTAKMLELTGKLVEEEKELERLKSEATITSQKKDGNPHEKDAPGLELKNLLHTLKLQFEAECKANAKEKSELEAQLAQCQDYAKELDRVFSIKVTR